MSKHPFEQAIFKVMTGSGSGTSFYLKDKNIFVTNYHVVGPYKQVAIQDHAGERHLATVLVANPHEDVALLRTHADFDVLQLELGQASMRQGDKVLVAGYPYGMPFTVTEGIVSAPDQLMEGRSYIQTDAAVNPGNSGGPMIDANGKIIAITTCKFNDADNMGFGVPVSKLVEEFEALNHIADNTFNLVCDSCATLISEQLEYCNNCGQNIDLKYFDEPVLSDVAIFCEDAISRLGINPILTRQGYEFWEFHVGSSMVRLFVYDKNYLYATSPINQLPTQEMNGFLEEILSMDLGEFKLGIYQKELFISYRVHLSDIFSGQQSVIADNIASLFNKANELDDYFVNKYKCQYSVHSNKYSN